VSHNVLRSFIRQILIERKQLLYEGVKDPGIFKAVFMAGCPGSGKGTVVQAIFGDTSSFTPQGLKVVNPDDMYEFLLKREKLGLVDPGGKSEEEREALTPEEQEVYQQTKKTYRSSAGKLMHRASSKVTGGAEGIDPEKVGLERPGYGLDKPGKERPKTRLETYIDGRLGLLLDGTAANSQKILREKEILEDLGYDTMMIVANVPVEVALERNKARGERGKRRIPNVAVQRTCERLQQNFKMYASAFGTNYIEIDNTKPTSETVTADVKATVDKFINSSPSKPAASEWIKNAQG
jgi:predicted ABC-type ATPase